MTTRGAWGSLAVALVLLAGAACSDGSGGTASSSATPGSASSAGSTTTTAPPSTTATTVKPEEAVKAAYLAYWAMVDRLTATPDPNDPELPQRAADPLLSELRGQFTNDRASGATMESPPPNLNRHEITAVSVDGASARLSDCFVDGRVGIAGDGTRNEDVVTKATTATLRLVNDRWLVASVVLLRRVTGASKCDA